MTRRDYIYAGAIAVAMCLGFGAGRWAAPDKVVTVDKLVTVDRVVTVDKIRTEVQQVRVADVQHDVRYVRVREKRPDGTVTDTVTRDDKSHDHRDDLLHVDLSKTAATERVVYQDREKVKLVERARPNWSAAFQPGYDLSLRRTSLGGSVERRVLGPLFAGAWANTTGAAGLTVRMEF